MNRRTSSHQAIIAFGSNLGDRRGNISQALQFIAEDPRIEINKVSSYFETTPVGGPSGQSNFINGALIARVRTSARELLCVLHEIEQTLHRKRERFWDARTIDLDLIWFDSEIIDEPGLVVPHPRLYWRSFVLDPICEIAPSIVVPTTQLTFEEHRNLLYCNFRTFSCMTAILRRKDGKLAILERHRTDSNGFI